MSLIYSTIMALELLKKYWFLINLSYATKYDTSADYWVYDTRSSLSGHCIRFLFPAGFSRDFWSCLPNRHFSAPACGILSAHHEYKIIGDRMRCITHTDRVVYFVTTTDLRKVSEARFKLADLQSSYGKSENQHFWSLPRRNSGRALEILSTIFGRAENA